MAERKVEYQKIQRGKAVGIRVEAPSLQRVFLDAALAFFDRLSTGSRQAPDESKRHRVEITATDSKTLLGLWGTAIRNLYVVEKFVATRAVFEKFDGKTLVAVLHGAPYTSMLHGALLPVGDVEQDRVVLSTDGPTDCMFSAELVWAEN